MEANGIKLLFSKGMLNFACWKQATYRLCELKVKKNMFKCTNLSWQLATHPHTRMAQQLTNKLIYDGEYNSYIAI